jgi:isocitrate lyase
MAKTAEELAAAWGGDERWRGVERRYRPADVLRLAGSVAVEHTLARLGAERLWSLLHAEDYVHALGALTGNQAVQMVEAGLPAIYVSGWQIAGDMNLAGETYPDQSLYPADSAPNLVRRINNALLRADQIDHAAGRADRPWLAPIVADAEAGFGGNLNAFELMKAFIDAGAAGVHFEDQLSSAKKCGHMGGKVLVPTREFEEKLQAARLAADVAGVPTLLIARTDANSAQLLTSDVDERDHRFLTGERTREGFFRIAGGLDVAIQRGLAYAPLRRPAVVRDREARPRRGAALRRGGARALPRQAAGLQLLAVVQLAAPPRRGRHRRFQRELGAMGYKFQFVTLAGFHALNLSMFELAAATTRRAWRPTRGSRSANSRSRRRATGRSSTRASSAPATSTRWRRWSPAAPLRRPRWAARPRRSSSNPPAGRSPPSRAGRA